jgi:hypothetical protein
MTLPLNLLPTSFLETTVEIRGLLPASRYGPSVSQPVFTLLETLYSSFDALANRRVFKVETVGDCYVAVHGLRSRRCAVKLIALRERYPVENESDK